MLKTSVSKNILAVAVSLISRPIARVRSRALQNCRYCWTCPGSEHCHTSQISSVPHQHSCNFTMARYHCDRSRTKPARRGKSFNPGVKGLVHLAEIAVMHRICLDLPLTLQFPGDTTLDSDINLLSSSPRPVLDANRVVGEDRFAWSRK